MTGEQRPSDRIEGLPGPLSEMPWSADFVMQAIELLTVELTEGGITYLKPEHADSFIVGWPSGEKPEIVAARTVERLGLEPIVLHSTSWRHQGGEAVLTYLAVVSAVAGPPEGWVAFPVARAELARGDTTAPPPTIGVEQVLEHALRHLAWLLADDPVIRETLPDWKPYLAGYVPEPFRALGGPPGT
jgi:hypothetical protein